MSQSYTNYFTYATFRLELNFAYIPPANAFYSILAPDLLNSPCRTTQKTWIPQTLRVTLCRNARPMSNECIPTVCYS